MSTRDRTLLMILPVVALMAAFWLLLLAPKRDEAKQLGSEVADLEKAVAGSKQLAIDAALARTLYPDHYAAVVRLGKAVPADDDTPSMFVQLNRLARRERVEFRKVVLKESKSGPAAPPPAAGAAPAPGQPPAGEAPQPGDQAQPGAQQPAAGAPPGGAGATPPAGGTAATEASAALLPLGATVGPAGFPVMPYEFTFRGSFFRIADFLERLDGLVRTRNNQVAVRGRLFTIDGFALGKHPRRGFPMLEATFAVTTYLTPKGEGLTAGATPASPAGAPSTQQVSTGTGAVPTSGGTP